MNSVDSSIIKYIKNISNLILLDEKYFPLVEVLYGYCFHESLLVRHRSLLALTQVLVDLCPTRAFQTKFNDSTKPSLEVEKKRAWEKALVHQISKLLNLISTYLHYSKWKTLSKCRQTASISILIPLFHVPPLSLAKLLKEHLPIPLYKFHVKNPNLVASACVKGIGMYATDLIGKGPVLAIQKDVALANKKRAYFQLKRHNPSNCPSFDEFSIDPLSSDRNITFEGKKLLSETALKCLGLIASKAIYFNTKEKCAHVLLHGVVSKDQDISKTCFQLTSDIIAQDCERGRAGSATLCLTQHIASIAKERNFNTHIRLLDLFMSIPVETFVTNVNLGDILGYEFMSVNQVKAHEALKKKKVEKKKAKRTRKNQKQMIENQVERELEISSAIESAKTRNKWQLTVLRNVFTTYFRILKKYPDSPMAPSMFLGLVKFVECITETFLPDIIKNLFLFTKNPKLSMTEQLLGLCCCLQLTRLRQDSADTGLAEELLYNCLEQSFYSLVFGGGNYYGNESDSDNVDDTDQIKNHNDNDSFLKQSKERNQNQINAIRIPALQDLFPKTNYVSEIHYSSTENSFWPCVFYCINELFLRKKHLNTTRVASFLRRILFFALHCNPHCTIVFVHLAIFIFHKYPSISHILDSPSTPPPKDFFSIFFSRPNEMAICDNKSILDFPCFECTPLLTHYHPMVVLLTKYLVLLDSPSMSVTLSQKRMKFPLLLRTNQRLSFFDIVEQQSTSSASSLRKKRSKKSEKQFDRPPDLESAQPRGSDWLMTRSTVIYHDFNQFTLDATHFTFERQADIEAIFKPPVNLPPLSPQLLHLLRLFDNHQLDDVDQIVTPEYVRIPKFISPLQQRIAELLED